MKLFASVLVMLATALVIATPASATQLCADTACEEVYESGQVLEAGLLESTSSSFTLGGALGTVSCTESTLKGETTSKSAVPLPAKVNSFSFAGCKTGETSCTVSAVHLTYKAAIEETGGGNGTLALSSGGSGNPGVEVSCGFLKCTATATEPSFNVEGGGAAIARIKEAALTISGASCSASGKWTAEYLFAEPNPMQVGQNPTLLCKTAPNGAGECTKGDEYQGVVNGALAAGVASISAGAAGTITCGKSTLQGQYPKVAKGPFESLVLEGSTEIACSSTLAGNPKVTFTAKNFAKNSHFEYRPQASYQGAFSVGSSLDLELEIKGKATVKCNYQLVDAQPPYGRVANANGSETLLNIAGMRFDSKDGGCPRPLDLDVLYALTQNKNKVYVAKPPK